MFLSAPYPKSDGLPNEGIHSILKTRQFWNFQFVFWSVAAVIQFLIMGFQLDGMIPLNQCALLLSWRISISFVLTTLVAWGIARMYWHHPPVHLLILGLGVISLLYFTLGTVFSWSFFKFALRCQHPRELLVLGLMSRFVSFFIWMFFLFRLLASQRDQLLKDKQKEAQLALLQAQVNPHFLFNSLNFMVGEAENPTKVREMTTALSEYLRYSVKQGHDGSVGMLPLKEEIEALKDYLRVHQIRFEEKLITSLDADEEALVQSVPQAIVQPLLENAIKYGQQTSPDPLLVRISAKVSGTHLVIGVENSGHWIEGGAVSGCESAYTKTANVLHLSTGTGLSNLRQRLELVYGAKASLEIERYKEMVCVRMILPISSN